MCLLITTVSLLLNLVIALSPRTHNEAETSCRLNLGSLSLGTVHGYQVGEASCHLSRFVQSCSKLGCTGLFINNNNKKKKFCCCSLGYLNVLVPAERKKVEAFLSTPRGWNTLYVGLNSGFWLVVVVLWRCWMHCLLFKKADSEVNFLAHKFHLVVEIQENKDIN